MITFHFVEQGSEQWHIDRNDMYTGSGAEKTLKFGAIEYSRSKPTGFGGNFWTKRGHLLEDEAVELYETITKTKILRNDKGIKVGYITNSKYPGCLYSPDGVPPLPIIEVKCFDVPAHMELINGNIPMKIEAQVQFGLMISERPYAHLIPYNPKIEDPKKAFKIITIKANKAVHANFKRILTKPKTLERV
jgi:hypothetical protein